MTIRKLLLPALIAAALAAPSAFAQSADKADKGNVQDQSASKSDSKADAAKADARKDKQDAKSKAAKKDAKPRAEEQPDEPEEDGR